MDNPWSESRTPFGMAILLPEPTLIIQDALDPKLPNVDFSLHVWQIKDNKLDTGLMELTGDASLTLFFNQGDYPTLAVPGLINLRFVRDVLHGEAIGIDIAVYANRIKKIAEDYVARNEGES